MKKLSILLLFCAATLGSVDAQTYAPRVAAGGVTSVNGNTGAVSGVIFTGADASLNSVSSTGNIMSSGGSVGAQGSFISGNAYFNATSGYLQGASDGNWRFFNQAASLDGNVQMGNLKATGAITVASGTNAHSGTFTLAGGAATVSNTSVTANSVFLVTVKTPSGTRAGNPDIVPTAGTGFTATAAGTDTSTYNYVIIEHN